MKPIAILVAALAVSAVVAGTEAIGHRAQAGNIVKPGAEQREQALKESIERLSATREQVYDEVIALRRELAALRRAAVETNEVIVIKISLPPRTAVKVERSDE